jgi:hypothetical protein
MKGSIREKINRNDGKYVQIDNHELNGKEIVGYSFLILALLVYLLVDKVDFQYSWFGWVFFAIGFVLVILGIIQNEKSTST